MLPQNFESLDIIVVSHELFFKTIIKALKTKLFLLSTTVFLYFKRIKSKNELIFRQS